jgi:hypothetical protein
MIPLPGKVLYYPVWVSATGRISLRWGKPCDTASEAAKIGKAQVAGENATVAFVVRFGDGKREPLTTSVYPPSARRIIEHWESLWEATEGPEG